MSDHECFRCPECGSCPACAADALDRVIDEAESLRERLEQYEAYAITVASALDDRAAREKAERERDEWRANAILHGGNFEREALEHNTTRSSLSRAVEALREIESRTGHFGEAPPPPEWMPMLSLIAWVGRTARATLPRPGAGKEGER